MSAQPSRTRGVTARLRFFHTAKSVAGFEQKARRNHYADQERTAYLEQKSIVASHLPLS
jgi:hypothetical protein